MLQNHKNYFRFSMAAIYFLFIDRDIVKLYFKIRLWNFQRASKFLVFSKHFRNRAKKYFWYKPYCKTFSPSILDFINFYAEAFSIY